MSIHVSRYVYRLRPGAGKEYDARHAKVWDELRDLLRECGVLDYTIWRYEEIVVCEMHTRHTLERTFKQLEANEVQRAWSEELAPLFQQVVDDGGNPLFLRESFRLERE